MGKIIGVKTRLQRMYDRYTFSDMSTIKLAAVNLHSFPAEPIFNAHAIASWIERLSRSACRLVLFPELSLTGYIRDPAVLRAVEKDVETAMGIQMCWEAHYPELTALYADKGACTDNCSETRFLRCGDGHQSPRGGNRKTVRQEGICLYYGNRFG